MNLGTDVNSVDLIDSVYLSIFQVVGSGISHGSIKIQI